MEPVERRDAPISGGYMDLPHVVAHETREPEIVNYPAEPSAIGSIIRKIPVVIARNLANTPLKAMGANAEKWNLGTYQTVDWIGEREEVLVDEHGVPEFHRYGYRRVVQFHVWVRDGDIPPMMKKTLAAQVAAQSQNGGQPS